MVLNMFVEKKVCEGN